MPLLEVESIVVQFPAVRALDGVSLAFEPGEVHGLVGENGAGKSTLMRVVAGLQPATSGTVRFDGREVRLQGVREALELGIAMIHQELNLVDTLSVAENVFLGREPTRRGLLDRARMSREAKTHLERVGASFSPYRVVGDLALAERQLVEIAKALSYEARVLIMDEPTAVLSERETERLFALIGQLRAEGVAVLYISHRLAEVRSLCDRVSVLRDGRHVRTLTREEADLSLIASLMVGRELGDFFPPKSPPGHEPPALTVRDVGDGERVHGVSLELRPGEIVGLAGLVGAGRTELAETLIGVRPVRSGSVLIEGHERRVRSPQEAAKYGLAYVSEDRKDKGLHVSLDVVQNVTLANLRAYARPVLRRKEEERGARKWIDQLGIRVGSLSAPLIHLSGGNQQKVAFSKWLELSPKVLILDEPTRGVDVGAKREMYLLIQKLAEEGMACLVISSELPELIGLCHRVLVMREGRLVGEVAGEELSEDTLVRLAAGVAA